MPDIFFCCFVGQQTDANGPNLQKVRYESNGMFVQKRWKSRIQSNHGSLSYAINAHGNKFTTFLKI